MPRRDGNTPPKPRKKAAPAKVTPKKEEQPPPMPAKKAPAKKTVRPARKGY